MSKQRHSSIVKKLKYIVIGIASPDLLQYACQCVANVPIYCIDVHLFIWMRIKRKMIKQCLKTKGFIS